jgi:hypothetical protein
MSDPPRKLVNRSDCGVSFLLLKCKWAYLKKYGMFNQVPVSPEKEARTDYSSKGM